MIDNKNFLRQQRENARALGKDPQILRKSRELLHDLHEYHYSYLWTSGGLPIIQTPADIVAQQEVVWRTKPSVIIETGIARGGSLINSAMSLELNGGRGIVIGLDIDIREENRSLIENHPFSKRIVMIEGSSTDESIVGEVRSIITPADRVMVCLDSDHTLEHVLAELELLSPLVSVGCYLVVADTMLYYATKPVMGSTQWESGNDPLSAVKVFMEKNQRFERDEVLNGKLIFSSSFNGYYRAVSVE